MQIVFDLIINKDYDPLPANTEPEVKSLIERMLQKDPSKRPSIWDLEKIPCIDEKIKLFFKEHSDEGGEGTYGAVGENP
jgi:NIMA (never in mitosis gene a)-related kinase